MGGQNVGWVAKMVAKIDFFLRGQNYFRVQNETLFWSLSCPKLFWSFSCPKSEPFWPRVSKIDQNLPKCVAKIDKSGQNEKQWPKCNVVKIKNAQKQMENQYK